MDSSTDDVQLPAGTGPLAFQRTIPWLLAGAGKLVLRRWTEIQSQLDLTSSQHKLLLALDETGPLGQQRLAELVGIDRRNAVPIIETSVEQGLLIRQVDPADRRRRVLELTSHGRRVAKTLRRLSADIEKDLLTPLAPAERTELRSALQTLLDESNNQH
ncbi:MarR family winged helix-turn-helix transcriptional regulator [Nocardia miyunensis]|uniref:MarR family winged helix-turn-helix transcriptional regulator n=1 Tax=Nocardia miyunensis TaxID=282684 RepID=UPI00082B75CD|nr:MarR family winged helix-turn-helix transcriptional regulator [Nocardia miyunensis]